MVKNNNLKIYPNPSNGELYVEADNSIIIRVEIISELGQVIYIKNYGQNSSLSKDKIKINNYKPGLYILKVTTTNNSFLKKVFML